MRENADRDPVLVLRRGRPLAAVIPMTAQEWEDWIVTHDPDLVAATRLSRERFAKQGGLSLEQVGRRSGVRIAKPTTRRAPKATARRARVKR